MSLHNQIAHEIDSLNEAAELILNNLTLVLANIQHLQTEITVQTIVINYVEEHHHPGYEHMVSSYNNPYHPEGPLLELEQTIQEFAVLRNTLVLLLTLLLRIHIRIQQLTNLFLNTPNNSNMDIEPM
jgi:hypothetical protein